ncbi:MAG: FGGY-family carbohydrate kinase, partial [Candidatus Dormibacteraeota bacterium]|nr:FGGY-family carbohydrate kinase [Candidatus Dormibacteraeota bacterium]
GCTTPARRAVSIGTSAAVRVIHSSIDPSLPAGLWRYRLDRRRFITGGALSNGGNLREWLLATLRVVDEKIETNLRRMVPGAHGLTFMPHLAGERGLGYAPRAFGAIAGLTLATKPEDIARAGLEAIAVELARVNRRMDEVMPQAKLLVASGTGLLHSSAWLQMVADATGHTIAPSHAKEASARGAAIFAMERLGLERAARLNPGTGTKLKPRPSHASVYRQIEARQDALYRALVGDRILEINHSR